MPSSDALARDRSTLAALALVLAIAAGPAGLVSVASAGDALPNPPAATTPAPEPTPTATATAPTTPESEPAPTPTPAPPVDPTAAVDDFGPVSASAVVLPGPNLVPNADRIAPVKPGPSLRFVSAGHGLLTARMRSMNVKVDVAGAASLRAWAILPSQAVKAAGVEGRRGDRTLARASVRQPPSGRLTVKLRFDGPAQETLLRFLKVTVNLRIAATDAKGNTKTVEQLVELSD